MSSPSVSKQPLLRACALSTWLGFALCGWAPAVNATVFQVSPVKLNFTPTDNAQTLHVFNNSNEELNAQIRIMRWTQNNGQDVLTDATEVVASPAIARVAPGRHQTIRIVRLQPAAQPKEQAYRVLVDELPRPEKPSGIELKVLLRHSIPLFVEGALTGEPAGGARTPGKTDLRSVRAQIARAAGGEPELLVANSGPRALKISSVVAALPNGENRPVEAGLLGYVLPDSRMAWKVRLPSPLPPGTTLKARFNDDIEAQPIPMDGTGR